MIHMTSVTLVIISPHMKESKWIDWEIEYSLRCIHRECGTSKTNGIVGIIMKYDGGYEWFKKHRTNPDGCCVCTYDDSIVYDIINKNRYNQYPLKYTCEKCMCVDGSTASYISYVEEEDFLKNPIWHINNAYEKSKNDADGYAICKTRKQ